MSKWLDVARAAAPHLFPDIRRPVPCANSANSAIRQKTAIFCVPLASVPNSPEIPIVPKYQFRRRQRLQKRQKTA